MTKKFRLITAAALLISMALVLAGCSSFAQQGEFTGTLTRVTDDQISVETDEGVRDIKTDRNTAYDMGSEDHFCLDDSVKVEYRSSFGKMTAEKVTLVEHKEKLLSFEGVVAESGKNTLTVRSESLTVTFTFDEDTVIAGDPDGGDEVLITYEGNLSEFPYASVISVTKEVEKPKETTVSGIVSEFTETTFVIALDSATSYRFGLTPKTEISGVSKYIAVGDSVNVTYEGDVKNEPDARKINVVKAAEEERRTINGTIGEVKKEYLTLDTGKRVYVININKDTKYTGDKPQKGYKSEITYTGKLTKAPVAVSVYCVKSAEKAAEKESKKEKPVPVPAPPEPYVVPEDDPAPEPAPEPVIIPEDPVSADGVITAWRNGGANTGVIKLKDDSEITVNISENTVIADGYDPMEGDSVTATYLSSDMSLLQIVLIERPGDEDPAEKKGSDPDAEPSDDSGDDQSGGSEDASPEEPVIVPEDDDQTESDDQKQEEASDDAQSGDSGESASEPEEKKEEDPDVIVKGEGSIISGDEKGKTFKIKLKDGSELELNIDDKSSVAAGYFPQKDDEVKIAYNKKGMHLEEIQLINRPAQKAETADDRAQSDQAADSSQDSASGQTEQS